MDFPIKGGVQADRNDVVRSLLERQSLVESTFPNDEFLKLDLTHQELVGIKSTSTMVTQHGVQPITDLPALNYVVSHSDKYKESKLINIGYVNALYNYYSPEN